MHGHAYLLASGHYLHWGVVQISLTNFLIIVGMIALFVAALLVPFPGARTRRRSPLQRAEEARDDDD